MKRARETFVNETLSPLKRLKITTENEGLSNKNVPDSPSKETRAKKGHHFFSACQQILTSEYFDVKTRLEFQNIPDCNLVNNSCTTHDKESLQVLSYEIEAFKIDIKSGMWTEALDVFQSVTKSDKFPSTDMLGDVLHMILCAVAEKQIFSDTYIVKKCQDTFKMTLETHPPCVEAVRTCYKELLMSSFKNYENCVYYRDVLSHKENIFKTVINMLFKEFENANSSSNEVSMEEDVITKPPEEIYKFSNTLDNFALLERFDRRIRIKRLLIVLELLVDVLEKDLAIWIRKYFSNPLKHIVRPRKPLIVWMIWQSKLLHYGMVNNFCRDIFKLVHNLMKFNHLPVHINIGVRLLNLLFQTFYLCGSSNVPTYPEVGTKCETFTNELFTFIKTENINFILNFIVTVRPKQLRCLLSIRLVKFLLKSPENNFMVLSNSIFKACLWNRFKTNGKEFDVKHLILPQSSLLNKVIQNTDVVYSKLKNLLKKNSLLHSEIVNDEKCDVNEITQHSFINACYLALFYYADMYSIEKILLLHDDLCSGGETHLSDPSQLMLPVSGDCLRQYRVIVKTKTNICENLDVVRTECPFVYKLFKKIPLLQFV